MSDTEQDPPVGDSSTEPMEEVTTIMNGGATDEGPFVALNGDKPALLNGDHAGTAMNGDSTPIDDSSTAPPVDEAVEENGVVPNEIIQTEEPLPSSSATDEFSAFGEVMPASEAADIPASQKDDPFSAFESSDQQQEHAPSLPVTEPGDAALAEVVEGASLLQHDSSRASASIATDVPLPTERVAAEEDLQQPQEDPFGAFGTLNVGKQQAPVTAEGNNNSFSQVEVEVLTEESLSEASNGMHCPEVEQPVEEGSQEAVADVPVQAPIQQEIAVEIFGAFTDGPDAITSETPAEAAATNDSDVFDNVNAVVAGDENAESPESGNERSAQIGEHPHVAEYTVDQLAPPPATAAVDVADFAAPPQTIAIDSAPEETPAVVLSEESTGFGKFVASAEPPEVAQDLAQESSVEADDFGDFAATPQEGLLSADPTADSEPVSPEVEADDFGDLTASTQTEPPPAEKVAPKPVLTQEPTAPDNSDDDFGDFTATSKNAIDTTPEESLLSEPAAEVEADDFGDFATSSSQAEPVEEQVVKEPAQESAASTDDDFGDFVATPQTSHPVQEQSAPAAVDDDDFGKLGSFSDAAPSAEMSQASAATDQGETVDDFSFAPQSLNASPEPEITPVVEGDDNFGDFGDFNDAPPSATPETTPAAAKADDDFGGFGDFNDAPQAAEPTLPTPTPADDGDFSDFGDFSDAPEPICVAAEVEITLNDPLVDRAKAIFTELFGKSIQEDEKDESEVGTQTVALRDILAEILSETKEQESLAADWANEKLVSMLKGVQMCEKASPSVILDREAVQPYSHYSIPAVIPAVELKTGDGKSKRWSSESAVPQIEGVESALSEDVETPDEEVGNAVHTAATVVTIPPSDVKLDFTDFKAPLENGDSGIANEAPKPSLSAAKLFLQQIPNLTFMLSSTLSLPTKK